MGESMSLVTAWIDNIIVTIRHGCGRPDYYNFHFSFCSSLIRSLVPPQSKYSTANQSSSTRGPTQPVQRQVARRPRVWRPTQSDRSMPSHRHIAPQSNRVRTFRWRTCWPRRPHQVYQAMARTKFACHPLTRARFSVEIETDLDQV